MAIIFKVPNQARYVQTSSIFVGTFNVPTPGVYDFGVAANTGVAVFPIQPNTVYLVERVTFSGDISGADYAAALDLAGGGRGLVLSLRRALDNQSVYESALPFASYVSQQESSVFVKSDKAGDILMASLTGRLNQTPALVGIASIRMSVSFSVYCIESTIYNRAFRGSQLMGLAAGVRG